MLTLRFENKEQRRKVTKCGLNICDSLLFSLFVLQVIAFLPHVLLIVLDDLGWSDVGFHRGGPVRAFPAMCEAGIGEQS